MEMVTVNILHLHKKIEEKRSTICVHEIKKTQIKLSH